MHELLVIRINQGMEVVFSEFTDQEIHLDDQVIVEKEGKEEVGKIVRTHFLIPSISEKNMVKFLRFPNESDKEKIAKIEEAKEEATNIFQDLLKEHHLPIKLIKTVPSFGENKIVFYFFSEERVDFRDLVKELAKKLKKRVELWQINHRERAKLLGGLGPCGQVTCCNRFITEFSSIGVNMAKIQGLLVSPEKLSGICSRLMCCLRYELDFYEELERKLPKVGDKVKTPVGEGIISEKNLVKSTLLIKLNDGTEKSFPLDIFLSEKKRA
ncbi:MAG: hypothetical protein DDT42_00166 [candidate division WS2 bacterium]|uniref:PSP1 C-terminal domain-containing protein n=1 Tax=Psychracetigena formicireducens TaxID=2986056 RepID=A0A9E2BEW3_PSYF1|nr:hypothetical protein [Candidatus Psychracetigena formicireducens]MBT9144331.1 hypothetical protein [Candidatus Psychracetigena formicireducens]